MMMNDTHNAHGGGINNYNLQNQQMLQHQIYRGDNSISNGQNSHSSASGQAQGYQNREIPGSSHQQQRPNSLGGGNQSSNSSTGAQGYQQAGSNNINFQAFHSSNNVHNQNEANYKFTNGHANGGSLSGERPMSRGNSGQAKVPPSMQGYVQNGGQTYQIQQDQQNFHLPPGAFQNGVPNLAAAASGPGQPQFHFIANKQKFYAQITPDKALPLFNEKRPFTANNPMNGGLPSATSSNLGGGQVSSGVSAQSQPPILGKRGNSNNQKQQQLQQVTHLTQSGIAPPQLYANPYHLQIASKTHTGAFGGASLQNVVINPMASATASSKFNVASTGQLDTAVSNVSTQNPNQLVSIFNPPGGPGALQQPVNPVKVKVKAPNRSNIKEKEQLYEDAIKLKIQVNAYREENVRLKTKIKILENDMNKQERAMEEFITKFQVNQANGGTTSAITGLSSPILNAATGGQFGTPGNQLQPNTSMLNSNIRDLSTFNPSLMTSLPKPFLQQNETFLVMSLKKQVKELKTECQKKEEELDNVRKTLKNTRQLEIDVEIKTYIDECQRLRQLLGDMLREGPAHPLYQERLSHLEQQRQQNEYVVATLQAQNAELAKALQIQNDELGQRSGDKAARKEMRQELSKAKKTLREREKEIARLRQEVMLQKKPASAGENASFSSKEVNPQTATKTNINEGVLGSQIVSNQASEAKGDSQSQQQIQLKNLQKKVRDLTNDQRSKRSLIDQQESQIKQLEERLKQKEKDFENEGKKLKVLEEELARARKSALNKDNSGPNHAQTDNQKQAEAAESTLKKSFGKELELFSLLGRSDRIPHQDLCNRLKDDLSGLVKGWIQDVPAQLKESLNNLSQDHLVRIVPFYALLSEEYTQHLVQDAWTAVKKAGKYLQDKVTSDGDIVGADKLSDWVRSNTDLAHVLTSDHLDLLKAKYLETKKAVKPQGALFFNLKRLLDDAHTFSKQQESSLGQKPLVKQGSASNMTSTTNKQQTTPGVTTTKKQAPLTTTQQQQQKKSTPLQKKREGTAAVSKKEREPIVADIEIEDEEERKEGEDENYDDDFEKDGGQSAKKKAASKGAVEEQQDASKKEAAKEDDEEIKKEAGSGEDKDKAGKYMDEEEMLDVAEHCFIKMAESLIDKGRTARAVFTKYSIPEQFPDGTVLELLSPIGFLEGVKEAAGIDDLTEMEAACLLRVLAKPELDNAIILNEFTMIMENFGVPDLPYGGEEPEDEDDDDFDDYVRDEDYFEDLTPEELAKQEQNSAQQEEQKQSASGVNIMIPPPGKKLREKPRRRKIILNFEDLEPKGHKILRKLARFLLERYMHPREFYGPAIYRQMIKTKVGKADSHPVDILHSKDFYSRLKAAGLRKTVNQDENLNKFLRLDAKFPHLMQMKRVVKALEEVAQIEQKKMQEEHQKKCEAEDAKMLAAGKGNEVIKEEEEEDHETEDRVSLEESEQEEEEEEQKKAAKRNRVKTKNAKKKKTVVGGKNMDLIREAGVGGFVNDYFAGASGISKGAKGGLAGMLGTGFTALNTIEEEKHETQTSNYFRDAAGGQGGLITESERDYDNTHLRGSKILDDPDLINTSSKLGGSPHRGEAEFEFSNKHHSSAKQSQKAKASDILVQHGTPERNDGQKKKNIVRSDEKKLNKKVEDEDDYEQEEDYEDQAHQQLPRGKQPIIDYEDAEEEDEDEDYEEEEQADETKERDSGKKKKRMNAQDEEENESDYEF